LPQLFRLIEVERAASQGGCRLNVVMEVDFLENIKALVAAGMGYTLLSSRVGRHGPNATQLRCCPISDPCTERSIFLARSSKAHLSVAASSVSESLSMMFIC
jgi:LysR family nitrogen assimilation transcriptional regulator